MPKAAVIPKPNLAVEVRELPLPNLERGGVVLNVLYSEVCGTDVHLQKGQLAGVPYPLIPGHVTVGRIAETGGTVTDIDGKPFQKGETVTFLDVHATCGSCWYCLVAKASTRCPNRKVYGITYGEQDGLAGGWAEQIYLKPGTKLLRIPYECQPERFIAGGCGLPTSVHAIERAEIKLGDTVVVLGAGPVGLNAAILAQLCGAQKVIVIGAPDNRLEMAQQLGVDATISIQKTSFEERLAKVRELTIGRGADVTIEAAGAPEAVREGMQFTRDAGRIVVVGQYTDCGELSFNPHTDLNKKHLEIRGCWGSDYSHFHRAVQVVTKFGERFKWERMISKYYGLHQLNQALSDVAAGKTVKALVDPSVKA
jgi:L-iditol 2-dehydrogenase